jgi:hypothetical protein
MTITDFTYDRPTVMVILLLRSICQAIYYFIDYLTNTWTVSLVLYGRSEALIYSPSEIPGTNRERNS